MKKTELSFDRSYPGLDVFMDDLRELALILKETNPRLFVVAVGDERFDNFEEFEKEYTGKSLEKLRIRSREPNADIELDKYNTRVTVSDEKEAATFYRLTRILDIVHKKRLLWRRIRLEKWVPPLIFLGMMAMALTIVIREESLGAIIGGITGTAILGAVLLGVATFQLMPRTHVYSKIRSTEGYLRRNADPLRNGFIVAIIVGIIMFLVGRYFGK